jgi:hypothetical protein
LAISAPPELAADVMLDQIETAGDTAVAVFCRLARLRLDSARNP